MRCVYCEGEMELGFIQSPREVFWSKERRIMFFMPNRSEGDIVISDSVWKGTIKEAHLCKQCGKITMDI